MSPVLVLSQPEATVGSGFLTSSYSKLSRGRRFFLPFICEDKGGAVGQPLLPAAGHGVRWSCHKPLMSCRRSWAEHWALSSALWHRRSRLCKSGCRVHRFSILARSGVQCQPHTSVSPAGTTVLISAWALVELGQETEQRLKCCVFNLHLDLIYISIETINLVKRLFIKALNSPLRVWSLCVPWRCHPQKSGFMSAITSQKMEIIITSLEGMCVFILK